MDLDSVRASRHCKKLPIQKLSCTLQARQRGRGKEARSFQNIYKVRVLDLADDWLKTQAKIFLWFGNLRGVVGTDSLLHRCVY